MCAQVLVVFPFRRLLALVKLQNKLRDQGTKMNAYVVCAYTQSDREDRVSYTDQTQCFKATGVEREDRAKVGIRKQQNLNKES